MSFPRVYAAVARGAAAVRSPFADRRWLWALLLAAALAAFISGCGRAKRDAGLGERVIPLGQPVPKGGGVYKVGQPYQINGRWYKPREDASYDRVGVASWYGELFHGRRTANGEIYDMTALTAAHPTLPLPVYARVTNLANGRSLVVRVNDRGPYASDRIIDLSERSAALLGFRQRGTASVRVTYLGPAPLSGDDSYERRILASQPWLRYAAAETRKLASLSGAAPVGSTTVTKSRGGAVVATNDRDSVPVAMKKGEIADPMTVGSLPAKTGAAAGPRLEKPVFVQAGTFRQKENADRLKEKLAHLGPVEVLPTPVADATFYRVRVGPFAQRDAVDEALRQAEAAGAAGARISGN